MLALMKLQESRTQNQSRISIFVDSHVHIHDCFGTEAFLSAAARNFSFFAAGSTAEAKPKFVLCLTETSKSNKFNELADQVEAASRPTVAEGSGWSFRRGLGDETLIAEHPDFVEMVIVAGRQIVTVERLEILALGTTAEWEDGLPIVDVVRSVSEAGAIPVLPWGFGKWLGSRRNVMTNVMTEFSGGQLYLGDNSGRPSILPEPPEFALAKEFGMRVLPGSDPLPFESEYDRAGSFGFFIENVDDCNGVWAGLCTMLQKGEGNLHSYGSLESPLRFVRNQVAMQYVTRVANRRKAS